MSAVWVFHMPILRHLFHFAFLPASDTLILRLRGVFSLEKTIPTLVDIFRRLYSAIVSCCLFYFKTYQIVLAFFYADPKSIVRIDS